MFNIAFNGIITVNRGDSFQFPLVLNMGTNLEPEKYVLGSNAFVYFAVMEPNKPFENALIRKKFDNISIFAQIVEKRKCLHFL